MAAHCAGGNNGEAILTAAALLRTAAAEVRLAVGVATHEAQNPTARAARLVRHWFARRKDRLGAAQPWPRISGRRNRERGRYEQTRQDCCHRDFPEHHRRNPSRISIFRTDKNANLFHSTLCSPKGEPYRRTELRTGLRIAIPSYAESQYPATRNRDTRYAARSSPAIATMRSTIIPRLESLGVKTAFTPSSRRSLRSCSGIIPPITSLTFEAPRNFKCSSASRAIVK